MAQIRPPDSFEFPEWHTLSLEQLEELMQIAFMEGDEPMLECDACHELGTELIFVHHVGLCSSCSGLVMEMKNYRHSGRGIRTRRASVEPPQPKRLSTPPTPKEYLAILRRDNFTCRYCGEPGGSLTVDHVNPGGSNDEDNLVTACQSCNSRKGRRTPDQAGMALLPVQS